MSELKQSLARSKEELGRVRKQLEDKQGMLKTYVLELARTNGCAELKILVLCALGAGAEYEALKKAVADANKKAEAEQVLREKHEARVIAAERELQEAVKKSEGLEQSLKGKESELAQALEDA